jgi:N-acyl-D-aspartate/D-glutamate deacylase
MTSRRDFLRTSTAAAAVLAGAPGLLLRSHAGADIVVRNGTVFDGLGGPGRELDVVISGGRIARLARRTSERGAVEIDARGLAVAPGFIDIHSHGDGTLWEDPRAESLVRQGITTIVVGQDGSSRAPRGGDGADDESRNQFARFSDLWTAIDRLQPSVNVASMIGLGTIRGVVIGGKDRPATSDELARMVEMVRQAIADGACGASSGLEYTPGAFAPLDELIALCKPLAARRLPYATHMRNEDDRLIEAIDESIAVARGAGCPLQISHLKTQGPRNWAKLDVAFARIAAARKAGCDAAFDRYPYTAYQTGLSNLFPVWSRDNSTAAFLARLTDASTADRIKQETLAKVELIGGWNNVMVSNVSSAGDKQAEGARLGDYAARQHADPYATAIGLLQRNRGNVGMVGFAMSEDNIDRILSHPQGMVCSDGGAYATDGPSHRGHPHPRGLGTFPRVLARYVRERKALTLEQAIHKMSAFPASRIHLADRGRIAPKMAADVVVFDPAKVQDTATYDNPFQYPVGIDTVIVNGSIALRDGQRSNQKSGRAVEAGRGMREG